MYAVVGLDSFTVVSQMSVA